MKTSRVALVGALAAALALAPALAASAAPVTSDVVPDTWADLTTEIFTADYPPLTPAGPTVFPLSVTVEEESGFAASVLQVSTPEGCTRVVNGMTLVLTSSAENPTGVETGVGSTVELNLAADFTFDYVGDGDAIAEDNYVAVDFESDEVEQTGTLEISLDEPIPAAEAFAAVGVYNTDDAVLTIESATFSVTDDCPVAVVPAAAAPELAATGTDAAPVVFAGASLLLLGGAAVMAASRRRAA